MAMKFVIQNYKNSLGKTKLSWSLMQNDEVLVMKNGFDTEGECRKNIQKVKKLTRFVKVEVKYDEFI